MSGVLPFMIGVNPKLYEMLIDINYSTVYYSTNAKLVTKVHIC